MWFRCCVYVVFVVVRWKMHVLRLVSYVNSFVYLRFKYGRPQNSYSEITLISKQGPYPKGISHVLRWTHEGPREVLQTVSNNTQSRRDLEQLLQH